MRLDLCKTPWDANLEQKNKKYRPHIYKIHLEISAVFN
jgi:hypothetical protein